MSKLKLNLGHNKSGFSGTLPSGHNFDVIKGTGNKDFPFPELEVIIKGSLKRAAGPKKRVRKSKAAAAAEKPVDSAKGELVSKLAESTIAPADLAKLIKTNQVLPAGQTRDTYEDGRVMLEGADGLQALMISCQFDALYESRFGRMRESVAKARIKLPGKYVAAIDSLGRQRDKLEDSYRQALPEVIDGIGQQNPGAPVNAVVQKAIEVLDAELEKIIYILQVYTDCFDQMGESKYANVLWSIIFFFEQTHRLYWGGDLENSSAPVALRSGDEHVGDVFLARVTDTGLATIPGTAGPVGAHAAQVPFDMLPFIPINLPLFGHEARHNVYHDVYSGNITLEAEQRANLRRDILAATAAVVPGAAASPAATVSRIALSAATYRVGGTDIPAAELIAKIGVDWIGEIDADFVGGVLFNGPAFGENMVMSFPAMMVRDGKVSQKRNLLRLESVFYLTKQKDGSTALEFEPHPIDYVRVHYVAAALDEIGFHAAATKLRQLADFAVGDDLPTEVTFRNAAPKSKMVITMPVKDLLAIAPVIARTLIRTPLKSQNGKSCADLVMWTQKRQEKVEKLADILADDRNDLPTDIGHIFASYIGAAATLAYLKLVREKKMEASKAALMVSKNAFIMLDKLRRQAGFMTAAAASSK
jgi:hypothetical protein